MNVKQNIEVKVLEEVLKNTLVEDELLLLTPNEYDFTPSQFYAFFEKVMAYADKKDLLTFKADFYFLTQTCLVYKEKEFVFSELSGELDREAFSVELSKNTSLPKFTYEELLSNE